MRLGKTLHSITTMTYLLKIRKLSPPFCKYTKTPKIYNFLVVIAPLSVINNWVSEFQRFSPEIPIQEYAGSKEEREEIKSEIIANIRTQPKEKRVFFFSFFEFFLKLFICFLLFVLHRVILN